MTKTNAKKNSADFLQRKKNANIIAAKDITRPNSGISLTPNIQLKSYCPCEGGCPRCMGMIQPKLTIGQPNDKYEQEADRVAEQVMHLPEPGIKRKAGCSSCGDIHEEDEIQTKLISERITSSVQLQEEEEEEEEVVQTKQSGGRNKSQNVISEARLHTASCGGQQLPISARNFFEPRFGHNFSDVKVHTCDDAIHMNRDFNSRAFTNRNNIFFNRGQYNPETFTGKLLLGHELTHVVQQDRCHNPMINKACLPAASCPSVIPGSAGSFGAAETARETGPRARRKGMTCSTATSTSHAGRARQLEIILQAADPGLRSRIHGIFIDADLSSGTEAMVDTCSSWVSTALPSGCTPPAFSGATKPCVFVHRNLNREAYQYNTTAATTIGGESREDWRISTLQTLIHEAQHVVFDTSGRPEPAGVALTCPRSRLSGELSELNAIMSEFPIVYRAYRAIASPGSARTHALNRLNNWFNDAITNTYESLAGTLRAMRCECDCAEVNAHIRDIFNLVSSSWSVAEKNAFNTELRRGVWNAAPHLLNWPL